MDFKWIGFLIEWILNGLDHKKMDWIIKIGFLTHPYLTISPSRVSPFNHIGTLPLQRKHSQPRVLIFYPFLYRHFS